MLQRELSIYFSSRFSQLAHEFTMTIMQAEPANKKNMIFL